MLAHEGSQIGHRFANIFYFLISPQFFVKGLGFRGRLRIHVCGKDLVATLINGHGLAGTAERVVAGHQASIEFLGQGVYLDPLLQ